MDHAAYLLLSTSLPICEIARACGIPDYNYFSKLFKKEYGCSPTVYRKRHFEDR
jgi:AraC-like DNA-binding protein